MDKRKTFKIILSVLFFLILVGVIIIFLFNKPEPEKESDIDNEYTPAEEITDEQIRQTIVTLYYNQKETNTLMPEVRLIDAKMLIENPYVTLVNLLISEPKNEKLQSCIPEGTVLKSAELRSNVVYLDFSNEFITNHIGGKEKEQQTIDAIVDTLTELNEVNEVRILVDGEENKAFVDEEINFENNFVRD